LNEFDRKLLDSIDEILRYVLGDINRQIIFDYLEEKFCPISEIPGRLDLFSEGLNRLLGTGRGQILCSAAILEHAIVERLCSKLGIKYDRNGSSAFSECIRKLREVLLEVEAHG
jgi:hypothetical protein